MSLLDPIRPYLTLVYVGLALAIFGALAWQRHTITQLRADKVLWKEAVQGYQYAQEVNLATVADLQSRITDMVEARRRDKAASDAAVASAAAAANTINGELAATTKELNDVYSKFPQARAWGDVGIPARVADRLPGARSR